jgi:hypothetical protein
MVSQKSTVASESAPSGGIARYVTEPLAAMATRAVTTGVGSIAGLAASPFVGFERGRQISKDIGNMAYEPRSAEGKRGMGALGAVLDPVARAFTAPERFANEVSPALGGATGLVTDAALTLLPGVKGIKSARAASEYRAVGGGAENLGSNAPLATRVDEAGRSLIEDAGGIPSKAINDSTVKSRLQTQVDSIKKEAGNKYEAVKVRVPPNGKASTQNLQAYVDQRLNDAGGNPALLDKADKHVLQVLKTSDEGMTYSALDSLRRKVGKGFSGRGKFKNQDDFIRTQIYDALGADQLSTAQRFGSRFAVEDLTNAQNLSRQYIGLQKNIQKLYGKNADGSITKPISAAANGLLRDDLSGLNKLVDNLPDDMKQSGRASVLNELMRPGKSKQITAQFSDTMASLSDEAKSALLDGFHPEIKAKLESIAKLSAMEVTPEVESFLKRTLNLAARHPYLAASGLAATGVIPGVNPIVAAGVLGGTVAKSVKTAKAARIVKRESNALLKHLNQ